jgi:hypothetical protein
MALCGRFLRRNPLRFYPRSCCVSPGSSAEQLIAQGKTVADVCRVIEVTQETYHRWRRQYGGMQAEEAKRLTQL